MQSCCRRPSDTRGAFTPLGSERRYWRLAISARCLVAMRRAIDELSASPPTRTAIAQLPLGARQARRAAFASSTCKTMNGYSMRCTPYTCQRGRVAGPAPSRQAATMATLRRHRRGETACGETARSSLRPFNCRGYHRPGHGLEHAVSPHQRMKQSRREMQQDQRKERERKNLVSVP